jgi:Fic family protein
MKPYVPETLPLESLDWENLVTLIGEANAALARYDGILHGIPNPAVLLSPLGTQEAVLSSRIEGTQATLEEVLEYEATATAGKIPYDDIREIINYRKAMQSAVEELHARPISLNLIRNAHSILLASVRGKNKARGRFRISQNWIGSPGCTMEEATYVPPAPERLATCLGNWEQYVHYAEKDRLVQLSVVHAQFEVIHPFMDGNGRVGRMLIPLFLFEKGLLMSPMFYISAYLEANRSEYYDRLQGISSKQDWTGWISFFLVSVREQAKENARIARAILDLYEEMKREVVNLTHSQYAIQTLDALFQMPIFGTPDFVRYSGIPRKSASRIIKQLREEGHLITIREASGRRPAILAFPRLIDRVEGRDLA